MEASSELALRPAVRLKRCAPAQRKDYCDDDNRYDRIRAQAVFEFDCKLRDVVRLLLMQSVTTNISRGKQWRLVHFYAV